MNRRIKLRDIADDLGLSVSTVSLALRRDPRIPFETAERVRRTAARLGYIYNRAAADLRQSRSSLVAVALSDLANPVFNEFLEHIQDELTRHGRHVFLGVAREDPELQRAFLQTALEQGVGGVILCPVRGTKPQDLDVLLPGGAPSAAIPTVLFSRAMPDLPVPQFVNDDLMAGRLAAEVLISAGHKRICWLGGGHESSTARNRLQGCLDALSAAGLPPPRVLHGPTLRRFGLEAARAEIAGLDPPTGFVCFSDLIAFGVVAACHDAGMMPGRDFAIVGCDDMEEAAFTFPGLTTVQVDKRGIGRAAARQIISGSSPAEVTVFAPRLIHRGTVGPADD